MLLALKCDAKINNFQMCTPADLASNFSVWKVFQQHDHSLILNSSEKYCRFIVEGQILKNSRADHVHRILTLTQKSWKM